MVDGRVDGTNVCYIFYFEVFVQEAAAPIALPLHYIVCTKEEPFVI